MWQPCSHAYMSRVAPALTVSDDERIVLLRWSKGRRTPARLVRRAKIVLRAADGWLTAASAGELGTRKRRSDSGGVGWLRRGRPGSSKTRRDGGDPRRCSVA